MTKAELTAPFVVSVSVWVDNGNTEIGDFGN